jgi:hypothetical protein
MTITGLPGRFGRGQERRSAVIVLLLATLVLTALGPTQALALKAAADQPTSILIHSDKTTVYHGKSAILGGDVTPGQEPLDAGGPMTGKIMVAYVMKPGKTYWSYSSNRVMFDIGHETVAWWYRYTFKAGMTKGWYKFKAFLPKYDGFTSSQSSILYIRLK